MVSYRERHVLLYMLDSTPQKIITVSGIYFGVDYFDKVTWTAKLPPVSCIGLMIEPTISDQISRTEDE